MAQNEPPHQDLRCLQIQLYASLVVKEINRLIVGAGLSSVTVCFTNDKHIDGFGFG